MLPITYLQTAEGYVPGTAFILDVFEYIYDAHRRHRLTIIDAMRAEQHNSGRAALAHRAPNSVNGTEVRGSERWHQTPARAVCGADGKPIDRTCYRVLDDGTRVPLVSTRTATRRKRAATTTAQGTAQTYEARVARFGAVGSDADA